MSNIDLDTKTINKVSRPKMFNAVLINDDFTPMDFVVAILVHIFGHDIQSANNIMTEVHKKGKSVAGTYTLEVAETKAGQTMQWAKSYEYPLLCQVEEN